MKKISILLALTFSMYISFGQGLQKGNLLGLRTITVQLKPGVTMEKFKGYFIDTLLPAYEKAWVGLRGYLLQTSRGKKSFALIWLFESEAARNRYFTSDDKANELEKAAYEKVKPVEEGLKKYGEYTIAYKKDDDWTVQ